MFTGTDDPDFLPGPPEPETVFDRAVREGKRVVVCTPEDFESVSEATKDYKAIVVAHRHVPLGVDGKRQMFIIDPSKMESIEFKFGPMTFERQEPAEPLPGADDYISWLVQQELERIRDDVLKFKPDAILKITGV
jgi:hypothetical protein